MRFQTTETVQIDDSEKVIDALEASLREFSDELRRDGHKIILYGLGPSPRSRNYRDIAFFEVVSKSGITTIYADVSFQASALLGASSQDAVVRSKLNYAFDQVRMQLNLPEAALQTISEPGPKASSWDTDKAEREAGVSKAAEEVKVAGEDPRTPLSVPIEEPIPLYVEEAAAEFKAVPETLPLNEEDEKIPTIEKDAQTEEDAGVSPSKLPEPDSTLPSVSILPEAPPAPASASAPESSQPVTQFGTWAASLRSVPVPRVAVEEIAVKRGHPAAEQKASDAPRLKLIRTGDSHKTNLPILIVILLGVVVAAGSVYLFWAGLLNLDFAHRMASTPAAQPAATPAPVEVVPVQAPPPRHEEPDPKEWLNQWADALRGRDPELQASFYADPVVRYLGDTNVSTDALMANFRSAIQARDGLWTVKLERVSIDPQSDSHVIARLTKHFMQLDDSGAAPTNQIADRYVRSRLELRRIDGEWKIVSEQDLSEGSQSR